MHPARARSSARLAVDRSSSARPVVGRARWRWSPWRGDKQRTATLEQSWTVSLWLANRRDADRLDRVKTWQLNRLGRIERVQPDGIDRVQLNRRDGQRRRHERVDLRRRLRLRGATI